MKTFGTDECAGESGAQHSADLCAWRNISINNCMCMEDEDMKNARKIFCLLLTLALALTACGSKTAADRVTLKVGASSTPHGELLEIVKPKLAEQGIDLEIVIYDDYVLPNTALQDGTLDANYFQHRPYLESFNQANGTDLVSAGLIHYEPFGIYSETVSDLGALASGAAIIVPDDDSNQTRALLLLQQEKLIELPASASVETGVNLLDIVDDHGYRVQAAQADAVPALLKNSDEGTIAVINYNYALSAGYKTEDALAIEDASGDAAQTYANIIAVRRGDENKPAITALVKALQDGAVESFNETTGAGIVAITN